MAPTNKKVDELNDLVTESLPGNPIPLSSSDFLDNADDTFRYSTEYLNTLSPAGLPRHQICLKPGMPLMLMRNLCPQQGLCNGTRLIFQQLHGIKLLECIISGGEHQGRTVLIPRITLHPKEGMYPFNWSRRQFPVRTAFAITINKVGKQFSIFISSNFLPSGPRTDPEECWSVVIRTSVRPRSAQCGCLQGGQQGKD